MCLKMKSVTLYLLFAVYLQLRYGDAVTTTYRVANDGYIFRNLLLTEVGSLIVGSNLTLERLSGDLEMLQSVNLPAGQPNRLLVGDPGGTYGGSFLACVRMNCELLNVNDITTGGGLVLMYYRMDLSTHEACSFRGPTAAQY